MIEILGRNVQTLHFYTNAFSGLADLTTICSARCKNLQSQLWCNLGMISAMAAVVAYNNDYISGICGKDVYQWLKYMTAFASVRQYYQLWQSRLCNWWYWVHIRNAQRTLRAVAADTRRTKRGPTPA
ncbi:hypothetical protein KL942_003786 [Ogataea angusta]|uniref:Uncharacterized protein n=1 Tax=Pichia angusta TaxID=870730 RepID=A0ABQ7RVL4_PICAN|nr:hypothetical protein KL942_003786 [Ogataea angusta]KAG7848603.1 hypothetical protein KL940_003458 [Ogataea angusta]